MEELISLLDLQEKQQTLMILIYNNNILSLSNISKITNIPRSICYTNLKELMKLGLIKKHTNKGITFYCRLEKKSLINYLNKKLDITSLKLQFANNFYLKIQNSKINFNKPNVSIIKSKLNAVELFRNINTEMIYLSCDNNTDVINEVLNNKNIKIISNFKISKIQNKVVKINASHNLILWFSDRSTIISYNQFEEYIIINSTEISNFFKTKFKLLWNLT